MIARCEVKTLYGGGGTLREGGMNGSSPKERGLLVAVATQMQKCGGSGLN